eukprot:754575-Hanusia_phi.AAC.5
MRTWKSSPGFLTTLPTASLSDLQPVAKLVLDALGNALHREREGGIYSEDKGASLDVYLAQLHLDEVVALHEAPELGHVGPILVVLDHRVHRVCRAPASHRKVVSSLFPPVPEPVLGKDREGAQSPGHGDEPSHRQLDKRALAVGGIRGARTHVNAVGTFRDGRPIQ